MAKTEKNLPSNAFAFPSSRSYRIDKPAHAAVALKKIDAHGSERDKQHVHKLVSNLHPAVHQKHCEEKRKAAHEHAIEMTPEPYRDTMKSRKVPFN